MALIERRGPSGTRLERGNNRELTVLAAPNEAEFRAMGCPDHLIARAMERRSAKANRAKSDDVLARAKAVGAQVEADKAKLAAMAAAPAAPAHSVVDSDMAARLKAASGRISR